MLLISLYDKKISIISLILHGISATLLFIGISIFIDSYFWGYWLYPEGQVLFFNTVLNQSSKWGINIKFYFDTYLIMLLYQGTSHFMWYFYSAIPRMFLSSIFIFPFALFYSTKKEFIYLLIPSIGFVFVYSFLPHKELRFIIYIFPFLNAFIGSGIESV